MKKMVLILYFSPYFEEIEEQTSNFNRLPVCQRKRMYISLLKWVLLVRGIFIFVFVVILSNCYPISIGYRNFHLNFQLSICTGSAAGSLLNYTLEITKNTNKASFDTNIDILKELYVIENLDGSFYTQKK